MRFSVFKYVFLLIVMQFVCKNAKTQTEYFVTIDTSSAVHTKINSLPGVAWVRIVPSYHVFCEDSNQYIFLGADQNFNNFLYTVDAATGGIVSSPPFPVLSATRDNIIELQYDQNSHILYGLHWDDSQGMEYLVRIDPKSGLFSIIDSILMVKWILINPKASTFNSNDHHYIFRGADANLNSYLLTIDATNGSIVSSPSFPLLTDQNDVIGELEYDNGTKKLYGLFWDNSEQTEYFVSINTSTGQHSIINSLPGVKLISIGYTTIDEVGQKYIFGGEDDMGISRLYSVDLLTGNILSKPLFPKIKCPSDNINLLRFDNSSEILYGVHWGDECDCDVVSGQSGIVYNADMTDSAYYKVTVSGAAKFDTVESSTYCGLFFPKTYAPCQGLSDSTSFITYSFSKTISSIKLIISRAGYRGYHPYIDMYHFLSNVSDLNISTYSGSCPDWHGNSSTLYTHGEVENVHATISSDTGFNILTISTSRNKERSVATTFGLCKNSLVTSCNTFDTINVTACTQYQSPSGKYTWYKSGKYQDITPNSKGCDSIITINLKLYHHYPKTISVTSCNYYTAPSGKYNWDTSGTYYDTLTSSVGCDSVIIIDLSITQNSHSSITHTACDIYESPSGRCVYDSSGNYTDTLTNIYGCDSIITIDLTINKSGNSTVKMKSCDYQLSPSQKYTWTESGEYNDTILNSNNCDSIINVDLVINKSSLVSISSRACNRYISPSQKYIWTESGQYNDTLANAAGCDSIISIDLKINQSSTSLLETTSCDSFIVPSGNRTFMLSGYYQDTILNMSGCDSIISIDLRILKSDTCGVCIPNAFTPNNDGLNDYISPTSNCGFLEYQLKIFNRWGEMIFESDDPDRSWSGEFSGNIAPVGVYIYMLKYRATCSKDTTTEFGAIHLIR